MNDHRYWIHRLSEVVDGTLDPGEREDAQAHLASCEECRRIVADLGHLVAEARALGEVRPSRDLWPDIEAHLEPRDRDVISLPTAATAATAATAGRSAGEADAVARRPGRSRRGLFLSLPELTAAAAVLVLASSALTWWAGLGETMAPALSDAPPGAVRSAATESGAPPELAEELESLTRALETGGQALDPNTRRIIEKNLSVIERAIEDSRRALVLDPANAFLQEHLDRAYERKLSYLQEAAGIMQWVSS